MQVMVPAGMVVRGGRAPVARQQYYALVGGYLSLLMLLVIQAPKSVDGRSRLLMKTNKQAITAELLDDTQNITLPSSSNDISSIAGNIGITRREELQQAVRFAVDASLFDSVTVSIGTQHGQLLAYQKGENAPAANETMIVASASKWVSGIMTAYLMQSGALSMDTKASDVLDFWSSSTTGNMRNVTLRHLLSMTSGLTSASNSTCLATTPYIGIQACAQEIYESYDDVEFEPGTVFQYSNQNLEISAAMAEAVTNKTWWQLYNEIIVEPLQLQDYTVYNTIAGPDHGLHISTDDYTRILKGRLLTPFNAQASPGALTEGSLDIMSQDLTPAGQVEFDMDATPQGWFGTDIFPQWHYGLRHWIECPDGPRFPEWSQRCTGSSSRGVHSSLGALGFYPIIDHRQRNGLDVSTGLYIIVSPRFTGGSPFGDNPAMVSALQTGSAVRAALDKLFPPIRDL